MILEEQAARLQEMKQAAELDLKNPKQQLLSELCDTVSLLCHHVSLIGEVTEGLNETMDALMAQLELLDESDFDEVDEGEIEDYFAGSEMPLYGVTCPQCGDTFAVDEKSLTKGFSCPNCNEHLIQA